MALPSLPGIPGSPSGFSTSVGTPSVNVTFPMPARTLIAFEFEVTYTITSISPSPARLKIGTNSYGVNRTTTGTYTETIEAHPDDIEFIVDAAGRDLVIPFRLENGYLTGGTATGTGTPHDTDFGKRWAFDQHLGVLVGSWVDNDSKLYTSRHMRPVRYLGYGTLGWEHSHEVEGLAFECDMAFMAEGGGRVYLSYADSASTSKQRTSSEMGAASAWSTSAALPTNAGGHASWCSPSHGGEHLYRGNADLIRLHDASPTLQKLQWCYKDDLSAEWQEHPFLAAQWNRITGTYVFQYARRMSGVWSNNYSFFLHHSELYAPTPNKNVYLMRFPIAPERASVFGTTPGASGGNTTDTLLHGMAHSNIIELDNGVLMCLNWTDRRSVTIEANEDDWTVTRNGVTTIDDTLTFALPGQGVGELFSGNWDRAEIHCKVTNTGTINGGDSMDMADDVTANNVNRVLLWTQWKDESARWYWMVLPSNYPDLLADINAAEGSTLTLDLTLNHAAGTLLTLTGDKTKLTLWGPCTRGWYACRSRDGGLNWEMDAEPIDLLDDLHLWNDAKLTENFTNAHFAAPSLVRDHEVAHACWVQALEEEAPASGSAIIHPSLSGFSEYACLDGEHLTLYLNGRGDFGAPFSFSNGAKSSSIVDPVTGKPNPGNIGANGQILATSAPPSFAMLHSPTPITGLSVQDSVREKSEQVGAGTSSILEGFSVYADDGLEPGQNFLRCSNMNVDNFAVTAPTLPSSAITAVSELSAGLFFGNGDAGTLYIEQTVTMQEDDTLVGLQRVRVTTTFHNDSPSPLNNFRYARVIDANPGYTNPNSAQRFLNDLDPDAFALSSRVSNNSVSLGVESSSATVGTCLFTADSSIGEATLLTTPWDHINGGKYVELTASHGAQLKTQVGSSGVITSDDTVNASTGDYRGNLSFRDDVETHLGFGGSSDTSLCLLSGSMTIAAGGTESYEFCYYLGGIVSPGLIYTLPIDTEGSGNTGNNGSTPSLNRPRFISTQDAGLLWQ